jgi:hypothetical protein
LFEERQAAVEGGISEEERILFARTALGTAFEHLASRTIIAIEKTIEEYKDLPNLPTRKPNLRTLVVSGGVAANDFLRHVLRKMFNSRGLDSIEIVSPPVQLCTDNAAMIGWCGIEMYEEGWRSSLAVDPLRTWSMDTDSDGKSGIVSVPGWAKARKRMSVDEWLAQSLSHKQIGTKFEAARLRQLNNFNRVSQKTQLERLNRGRPGERPTQASQAGSPAKDKSSQGHLGTKIDSGPLHTKVPEKVFPRNEFANVIDIVRKRETHLPVNTTTEI